MSELLAQLYSIWALLGLYTLILLVPYMWDRRRDWKADYLQLPKALTVITVGLILFSSFRVYIIMFHGPARWPDFTFPLVGSAMVVTWGMLCVCRTLSFYNRHQFLWGWVMPVILVAVSIFIGVQL